MNQPNTKLNFSQKTKLPLILQDEVAECGHACIAMISHFWGHRIDLYTLRKIHKPSTRGVNLREMNHICEELGFRTRAIRVPLNALQLIKKPAIIHWNMNHFVVLKSVKKQSVIIHDPALGVRVCSFTEFSQSFTGIVLEVEKASDFTVLRNQTKLSLLDLVKTVTGIRRIIGVLLVLSLFLEVLNLFNPLLIQYVSDHIISTGDFNHLYMLALGFLWLILTHAMVEYMRGHLVLYITSHLTESFSANVVRHLLSLPVDFFMARHRGDIQSKFQSIDHIQKKISTDFINTLLDGVMFVINLAVMLIYSRLLTCMVLVALFSYAGIRYLSYQSLKHHTAASIHQHAKAATLFLETVQAITPIKLFLKEQARFNIWRNGYIDALNADIRVSKFQIMYQVLQQLLFNLEHLLVICVGARLVLMQQLSVGMLIAFLAYRLMLVNKSTSFIQQWFDYKLIAIQLHRLSDILFQQPERVESARRQLETKPGRISLQNIGFKYNPSDQYLFKNIELTIETGEKIAIIGASGCGKSTLLKIMMGLLQPTTGSIYIDNIPLQAYGLKNYRHTLAAVMQDDALISGSILDNITFYDETIDMQHVEQVAKLANIHDVILQFPMAYETLIGDLGSTLSGGQKQRILLARALYKKPSILFLDEATSHLDVDNEQRINQALKSLIMTQIIIAHRPETIKMADRVFEL